MCLFCFSLNLGYFIIKDDELMSTNLVYTFFIYYTSLKATHRVLQNFHSLKTTIKYLNENFNENVPLNEINITCIT